MTLFAKGRCACARALSISLRFVFRLIRFLFILGLVVLPVPVAALVAVLLEPVRRNLPTEVIRKNKN